MKDSEVYSLCASLAELVADFALKQEPEDVYWLSNEYYALKEFANDLRYKAIEKTKEEKNETA